MEYIVLQSVSGPEINFKKGQVVDLTQEEAKPFLRDNIIKNFDKHVEELKDTVRKNSKPKGKRTKVRTGT